MRTEERSDIAGVDVASGRGMPALQVRALLASMARWRDVRVALIATVALRLGTSTLAALFAYTLHSAFLFATSDMNAHGEQRGIKIVVAPTTGWQQYIFTPWMRWDTNFYLDIAAHGYGGPGSSAFLPLYPFLVRLLSLPLGGSLIAAALVLSTFATFIMLLMLYQLAVLLSGSQAIAAWTVSVTCLIPIAFFFVAPYTESFFLALSLGAVLAALRGRWGRAALLASLASLVRQQGVLLAILALPSLWAVAARALQAHDASIRQRSIAAWHQLRAPLCFAITPVTTYAVWVTYLALVMRQPTPWQEVAINPVWNQHYTLPGMGVLADVRLMWQTPDKNFFPSLSLPLDVLASVLAVIGLLALRRRLPPALMLYLIACWCIALVKVMPDGATNSTARYLLALLPLCILPAGWLARGGRWLRIGYFSVCLYLACFCIAEWVLWLWIN